MHRRRQGITYHYCCGCRGKFTSSDAKDYAEGVGKEPNYQTCPDCLETHEREADEEAKTRLKEELDELAGLREEVETLRKKLAEYELVALRKEVKTLRKKLAASSTGEEEDQEGDEDDSKSAAVSGTVWVIVKGDWPEHRAQYLVDVDVLGTYSSYEKAHAAKEEFLEEGGWEEGYGYHQGSSRESTIEIISSSIDDAATEADY